MQKLLLVLKTHKVFISVTLLIAVFFVLGYFGLLKWGAIKVEQERFITVSGNSQTQKVNELATFNATVSVTDAEKVKAVNMVNERSQKVIDALKQFGIDPKDLKTTNMTVYQDQEAYWDNGIQKFRPGNWRADNSIEITLRDITKASDLSALLAAQETTNIYGPNFTLDTASSGNNALLASALSDAKKKAEAIASASGKTVGELISVVENNSNYQPILYKAEGMGGGGSAAPLEPGSTTVTKSVTATYALK